MSASGLSLSSSNVKSKTAASSAITALDAAIESVSTTRAKLGAT
ncbi:flagellin, partial [Motilibacter sp. E257]|nr:flagellin [Motilibacter deserti]